MSWFHTTLRICCADSPQKRNQMASSLLLKASRAEYPLKRLTGRPEHIHPSRETLAEAAEDLLVHCLSCLLAQQDVDCFGKGILKVP